MQLIASQKSIYNHFFRNRDTTLHPKQHTTTRKARKARPARRTHTRTHVQIRTRTQITMAATSTDIEQMVSAMQNSFMAMMAKQAETQKALQAEVASLRSEIAAIRGSTLTA